jgi:C_GCAxxG_C_C family probable redox protein
MITSKQQKGTPMKKTDIEKQAFDFFNSGYHCAESVFKAITLAFSDHPEEVDTSVASGFCGGIGKSKKEACGALTGGVIALGQLFGRSSPGENFDRAWQLAAEFRDQFEKEFKATDCNAILEDLGEQENMMKCKKLTGRAAGLLFQLIEDRLSENEDKLAG